MAEEHGKGRAKMGGTLIYSLGLLPNGKHAVITSSYECVKHGVLASNSVALQEDLRGGLFKVHSYTHIPTDAISMNTTYSEFRSPNLDSCILQLCLAFKLSSAIFSTTRKRRSLLMNHHDSYSCCMYTLPNQ